VWFLILLQGFSNFAKLFPCVKNTGKNTWWQNERDSVNKELIFKEKLNLKIALVCLILWFLPVFE